MENKSEKKFMTEIRLGNSLCLYWELGPRYYTTVYDYVLEMPPSTCFISEKRKNTLLSTNTFTEITLRHECSPVNLLHIFRTPFLKNTYLWLLLFIGDLSATMTSFTMIHFTPICFELTAEALISNKVTIGAAVGKYECENSGTVFSSVIILFFNHILWLEIKRPFEKVWSKAVKLRKKRNSYIETDIKWKNSDCNSSNNRANNNSLLA